MKKQTAVEWLVNQYAKAFKISVNAVMGQTIEQAKAMEKEQMKQAYSDGLGNGMHYERGDATESVLNEVMYYTQNYGGEE